MTINPEDQETIETIERAVRHVSGGCNCPARLSDGPPSPACLEALELACAAAQNEVCEVLGRARHDVWVVAALRSLERRLAAGRKYRPQRST